MSTNETQCPASPPGYFYQNDNCALLCRSTVWTDVLVFFLANYVTHVATVITEPGQSVAASIASSVMALLFPGTGIERALNAIYSRAIFAPTQLQMAARAGALYVVVERDSEERQHRRRERYEEVERDGEQEGLKALFVRAKILESTIHGMFHLPRGYALKKLDGKARFQNDPEPNLSVFASCRKAILQWFRPPEAPPPLLAYRYSLVKILAAIFQLAFAITTLYRARGDQIDRYGMGAFGLTVVPYAWMSLLNLLASVVCPDYSAMWLVETDTLRTLREKSPNDEAPPFTLTVGTLDEKSTGGDDHTFPQEGNDDDDNNDKTIEEKREISAWRKVQRYLFTPQVQKSFLELLCLALIPFAIIGGMSHFSIWETENPTFVLVIAMWITYGFLTGPFLHLHLDSWLVGREWIYPRLPTFIMWFGWFSLLLCVAFSIMGFVIVGIIIMDYGVCIRLPGV